MALPNTFTALTNATGAQLDANFNALGALTPIPCTIAGTNDITLTPLTNAPSQSSYANYRQYTGVVATSNAGAATAKVGSLAQLPIYKDSPLGPVALTGNEMIAGCSINLMYNSALNGGIGGFHLETTGMLMPFTGGTFTGPVVGTTISATLLSGTSITASIFNSTSVASIASLVVNAGSSLVRLLSASSSLSFAALNPQTGTTASIVVTGSSVGDVVGIGPPVNTTVGMILKGYVSAAGTVTMQLFNASSATVTPAAGTYRVDVRGYA